MKKIAYTSFGLKLRTDLYRSFQSPSVSRWNWLPLFSAAISPALPFWHFKYLMQIKNLKNILSETRMYERGRLSSDLKTTFHVFQPAWLSHRASHIYPIHLRL